MPAVSGAAESVARRGAAPAPRRTAAVLLLLIAHMGLAQRLLGPPPGGVRSQLSTKSPYAFRAPTPGASALAATPDPPGYEPAFVYVLSRHGTRYPTKDRAEQMRGLVPLLKARERHMGGWGEGVHAGMHACSWTADHAWRRRQAPRMARAAATARACMGADRAAACVQGVS